MTTRTPQLLLLAVAACLAVPANAAAYGYPVKPFHVQHPLRGLFGDPRIGNGGASRQFHFGVDVSAPNGTPVYATLTGTASIHPRHADVVLISSGAVVFEYWHVVPTVRTGAHVVAYRTVIGHIEKPNAHVHFSERRNGVYLNPLRPGALEPFVDHTKPVVQALHVRRDGRGLDLEVDVADETPLTVREPWSDLPVVPALVRWRVVGTNRWTTAADFRTTIPPASAFFSVYDAVTRQNHANLPGLYRIYLAHAWRPPTSVASMRVEVVASDVSGNRSSFVAPLASL